jgi:hypothetical protein
MDEEMQAIVNNGTWELLSKLPPDRKAIGLK